MTEKKFVVRPQNDGKVFGMTFLKVHMSDESLNNNINEKINVNLSDTEGFVFNKDSRFEVVIKQIR